MLTPKKIVIHWVALPGKQAIDTFNWFNEVGPAQRRSGSTHFAIGNDGEVIQMLPAWKDEGAELAYHIGGTPTEKALEWIGPFYKIGPVSIQNYMAIGIELNHLDWDGRFSRECIQAAIKLTVDLCKEYDLSADDVIRHYDVTGKNCPKWFVDHPSDWRRFKKEVARRLRPQRQQKGFLWFQR